MKSYIGSLLIGILLSLIFTIGMSFSRLDILDDRKRLVLAIGDFYYYVYIIFVVYYGNVFNRIISDLIECEIREVTK